MEAELVNTMKSTGLNQADWLIIAFVSVLTVISLFRGFIKEAMSLVRLAAAVVVGYLFAGEVSSLFSEAIERPEYAYALAYFALFVVTMIVGTILTSLLTGLITMAGLSPIDRMLGAIFGLVKGCVVIVFLVTLVNLTPLKDQALWRESALVPGFVELAIWSQEHLRAENIL